MERSNVAVTSDTEDVTPDLRIAADQYLTRVTVMPTPDETVQVVLRLLVDDELASENRGQNLPLLRVARQRVRDLRGERSRWFWFAWGLTNMMGTDISYGIKLSDEQLLREWHQGSEESLQTLIERHHGPLYLHIARVTDQGPDTAELAYEAFRTLLAAKSYTYPQPVKVLLYTAAHRLCQEQATAGRDGNRGVRSPLTPEQCEVLSLRIVQQLSTDQIAEVTGVETVSVHEIFMTALLLLRDVTP